MFDGLKTWMKLLFYSLTEDYWNYMLLYHEAFVLWVRDGELSPRIVPKYWEVVEKEGAKRIRRELDLSPAVSIKFRYNWCGRGGLKEKDGTLYVDLPQSTHPLHPWKLIGGFIKEYQDKKSTLLKQNPSSAHFPIHSSSQN